MTENATPNNPSADFAPEIRRARCSKLTIYDVTESELETLAQGSPDSIILNFSIFLFTVFISFLVALITSPPKSDRVFIVFLIFTIIGALGGVILLLIWLKSRKSVSKTIKTIKDRLPPEGVQEKENIQIDPSNE